MRSNREAVERALRRLEKRWSKPAPCRACGEERSIQDEFPWGPLCDECFEKLWFTAHMKHSLFGRRKAKS